MKFDSIKNYLISEANKAGIEEYELFYMECESLAVETLKDDISSFSSGVSGGVNFRCIVDGHMGCSGTSILTEEEMKLLVQKATQNAKAIESDDKAIIFEGSEKYETIETLPYEMPSVADVKELALSLQKETYAQGDNVGDGTQSYVSGEKMSFQLCNSKGLNLSHSIGMGGACVSVVVNGEEEAQDGFEATLTMDYKNLEDLSKKAYDDAISKLGADTVKSGKYDVIISSKQMRALLSVYESIFSGKKAIQGLSLLKGKEGEKIAADCITIVDDPLRKGSPTAISFDGEGVATYKKNVVENGVLKTLLYDLTTADKAGVKTTGNGQRISYSDSVYISAFDFYIEKGDADFETLLKEVGNGIYITELKGLHAGANAVTGDFSLESGGFLIENGKITKSIKGFTIAGNFFDLLKNIEKLSNNLQFGLPSGFTCYGSPEVLIRNMSIAGT